MSDCSPGNVAGATRFHLPNWEQLTSDPMVLQNAAGVKIIFDHTPHQETIPRQYKFNREQSEVIEKEILDLLNKEVITAVHDTSDCFISNIFLRPKPGGKFRMIIDLSDLNEFVTKQHFKMDHLNVASQMLFPGAWLASIDLKEAYYAIPVAEEDRKFLCFQWGDNVYSFNCVPFGLSSAPWVFTKTLKPIFAKFHELGFDGFGYIDDSFIIAQSYEECAQAVSTLTNLFKELGFRINEEKSVLQPCKRLTFLGYILDSTEMAIFPTEDKKAKVKSNVSKLLEENSPKIRTVASTLGLLNDVCKGCEFGPIYTKRVEMGKVKALRRAGRKGFEARMKISWESKQDLKWWLRNIDHAKFRLQTSFPKVKLQTDASLLGWGACSGKEKTGGRWSFQEASDHINVLELRAVQLGLKSLCSKVKHQSGIKILCDNTTSVAYLKHKGGTRSSDCNQIAREIWQWCESRGIWLIISHVPGVDNVQADFESRNFSEDTEWAVNSSLFHEVCDSWGYPDIDLFASRNNNQLPIYASWGPDPEAKFVDAFSLDWGEFNCVYIFPPFRLLNRVLQKVRVDKVNAIVVAPVWMGQPWFGPLQKAAQEIWTFPRRDNNLLRTEIGMQQDKSLQNVSIRFHHICYKR